nr:DNA repair protein RecO [Chiayiivirga flava]
MRFDAQPAYVLHAAPYRETSLLLETFTRDHGRIGLIARGVRGARGQPQRALLQPLQPLLLGAMGQGELLRLTQSEAAGPPPSLHGDATLAAFYLNELLLRLLPRADAQTALFWRYSECIGALTGEHAGWELRRFERDLLGALGYGLALESEALSEREVEPTLRYRFDPDTGPRRVGLGDAGGNAATISGAALLALARDEMPGAVEQAELRRLMRGVLRFHLGGRELRSWRIVSELAAHRGS